MRCHKVALCFLGVRLVRINTVLVSHLAERDKEVTYRVRVRPAMLSPALLSCADELPKAEIRYAAIPSPAPAAAPASCHQAPRRGEIAMTFLLSRPFCICQAGSSRMCKLGSVSFPVRPGKGGQRPAD